MEEEKKKEERQRGAEEQLSRLHDSFLTSVVRGILVEHTPVFEASLTPHAPIDPAHYLASGVWWVQFK